MVVFGAVLTDETLSGHHEDDDRDGLDARAPSVVIGRIIAAKMATPPNKKLDAPATATEAGRPDLVIPIEVEPRKPRLAWQGMSRKEVAVVEPHSRRSADEHRGELRTGIDTKTVLLARRPGAPKHWFNGFIQASHSLDAEDFEALRRAFEGALRVERGLDDGARGRDAVG
jgi:hypothetical protein